MTIPLGTKIGRYEIRAQLGVGGMGEVYLAHDAKLNRKVAIKLLPRDSIANEQANRRLEREARAAANLDHPNICAIYEVGDEDGRSFICMQYVEGETLESRMKRQPLNLSESLSISTQVVDALAEAHAHGTIHRDIKPSNIMITTRGAVKVMDFGLAKVVQQAESFTSEAETEALLSAPGTILGTLPYMSPEQVRGEALDPRSDIFSFGVVLYEMLTGLQPFTNKSSAVTASAILTSEPSPLTRFCRDVPSELERIVNKALRKDADERYQTAKDLMIDLKNLRRELDIQSEIKRPPASGVSVSGTSASSGDVNNNAKGMSISSTATSSAKPRTTSRITDILGGHKPRKLTTLVVLLLGIAFFAVWYYAHLRNTESTVESIAVMPLDNQNRDPDSEYLSDGLTESIINSLTQLPNLKVIPRSSVFRYKSKQADPIVAAKELGVRAIVTGRLVLRGDNLSVSVELLDVWENRQLWGAQYERKMSDLLAVQRDIAQEITNNLRLKLSGPEQSRIAKHYTENPEAYQLYLKGRFYWNKRTDEALSKAIECFQQAIEKDPNYALAYTGLADCYLSLGFSLDVGSLSPSEAIPKAKAAALKALEMDDSLAEAHTSLAFIRLNYDWDWSGAEREFKRAIELNPNYDNAHHWYSHYFMAMGQTEQSLAESKRALAIDPLGLIINVHLGWHYLYAHQYDVAIDQLKKTLEMEPNYGLTHWYLGLAYQQKQMYPEALEELRKARDLLKNNVPVEADMGYTYAVSGKRDEAEKILNQLTELSKRKYVSSYNMALIYIGLGEKDRALEWLENSYKERSDLLVYLKVEPRLDTLRSDPRFAELMRRVGLAQ